MNTEGMSQLEKYMLNIPLTPEIDELKNGPSAEREYQRTPVRVANMPLKDGDIRALRQLREYPGWSTLMNLLDSRIEQIRQNAILLCETDPVGNQEAAAKVWLHVSAWKGVRTELDILIEEAIQVGEPQQEEEKGEGDDSGVE